MALPRRGAARRTRGERRHLVDLVTAGYAPDGEGGWTPAPVPLDPPTWRCSIEPAAVRDLEAITAGTAVTSATHIVEGDYHAGITTETQILFNGRTLYVSGVINPEERNVDTICFCEERTA